MLDSSFSGFPGDTKKEKEMTFDMLLCSQIGLFFFFDFKQKYWKYILLCMMPFFCL